MESGICPGHLARSKVEPRASPSGLEELATPSASSTVTPASEVSSSVSSTSSDKLSRVVAQLSKLKLDFSDVGQETPSPKKATPPPPKDQVASGEGTGGGVKDDPKILAVVSSLRTALAQKSKPERVTAATDGESRGQPYVLPQHVSCKGADRTDGLGV